MRRDGQYRRVTSRGVPVLAADGTVIEWVGACTDVEDERRAADHLRQTQRIEAVGNLAGGVAHEVNNMMTAVIGFGGFVLKGPREDSPQRSDVIRDGEGGHARRGNHSAATGFYPATGASTLGA